MVDITQRDPLHRHNWCDVRDQEYADKIYGLSIELNITLAEARGVGLSCAVNVDGLGDIIVKVDRHFKREMNLQKLAGEIDPDTDIETILLLKERADG